MRSFAKVKFTFGQFEKKTSPMSGVSWSYDIENWKIFFAKLTFLQNNLKRIVVVSGIGWSANDWNDPASQFSHQMVIGMQIFSAILKACQILFKIESTDAFDLVE